jgi:hypothetical protein
MKRTLAEIEHSLPFGLTNAELRRIDVDYASAKLSLDLGIVVSKLGHTDVRRNAKVTVTGLSVFVVEPPHSNYFDDYLEDGAGAPWISTTEGHACSVLNIDSSRLEEIPAKPDEFKFRLLVHDWNSYIHFRAKEAELQWLD